MLGTAAANDSLRYGIFRVTPSAAVPWGWVDVRTEWDTQGVHLTCGC